MDQHFSVATLVPCLQSLHLRCSLGHRHYGNLATLAALTHLRDLALTDIDARYFGDTEVHVLASGLRQLERLKLESAAHEAEQGVG